MRMPRVVVSLMLVGGWWIVVRGRARPEPPTTHHQPSTDCMANLSFRVMPRGERISGNTVRAAQAMEPTTKKKVSVSAAWREARELVWAHRRRLGLGLVLMLVGRLAGLVLPASSKWLIDEVIGKSRTDLLLPIALAAGAATLVQAVTAFAL